MRLKGFKDTLRRAVCRPLMSSGSLVSFDKPLRPAGDSYRNAGVSRRQCRDLRRAFVTVLEKGILPARMPGTEIPQIRDLEEAQLMLTERANDWTRNWKQQGFEEGKREGIREGIEKGIEKGIEEARGSLLGELERRFGPLPADARLRVQALNSFKDLMKLSVRIGAASSLADLGLTGKNR